MSDSEREGEAKGIRIAAIDVGTNSMRLIIAEPRARGGYRVIDDEKIVTRLGTGLAETGAIDEGVMQHAIEALGRLKAIASGYNVTQLRVIATCALREASNADLMLQRVRDEHGIDIEVISSDDEARFAYQSVAGAFDLRQINAAIVDVGGGSTEIVLCYDGVIEQVYSLPLGAVRLTELFGPCDTPGDTNFMAMREHIRKVLRKSVPRPEQPPQIIFGTGGTFTNMASMSMHRGTVSPQSDVLPFAVRGYELQRDEIKHILHHLRSQRVRVRGSVPGLNPDRAEIIVAGMAIVDRVMKRLGANRVRVHDRGIRDGLLSQMVDELRAGRVEPRTIDRVQSARRFANACRYEREHSEHVAVLAMHIFDRLAERDIRDFEFSPMQRQLLESAALLHDIGYLINYSRHHKHSYHLIVHSDMPGFTNRELEIVANVARYHRRAAPRSKHPNFMKLKEEDREVVRRLAAILRIADGLDRSHTQSICLLDVLVDEDAAIFHIGSVEDAAVNVWGAERKSDLFARAFGMHGRFSVDTLSRTDFNARLAPLQAPTPQPAEAARSAT